ncbi:hypothetical protein DVH24_035764 [Malus domestica]|uniref:Serpin domain-containing protein n=1 Tax=Malus domestica TaxID=3750 RepID=A0A498JPX2_MALDO|nr:hypothetical protein DVH24_035764 [Malus domestica]
MVYSPLSIHTVLSLIAAGARGPTKDQLLSFLNSKSTDELNTLASDLLPRVFVNRSPSGGPHLSFANGLWVDKSLTIKPSFKESYSSSWFLHEAAAISAVVLLGSSLSTGPPPQKIDFVADHPFIFLIREENTKTVHHVGHVLNPLAG